MGLNARFSILCIGINLCMPIVGHALILSPVKVDSSQGEPLYAEITFSNAQTGTPVQVSIAQDDDLSEFGNQVDNASAVYNTFIRQDSSGNGVIVITSNKPVQTNQIDMVIKVTEGGQARLQHVHTALPSRIDRIKAQLNDDKTPPLPNKMIDKNAVVNLPTTTTDTAPSAQPVNKNTENKNTENTNNANKAVEEKPLLLNKQPPPLMTTQQNMGKNMISPTEVPITKLLTNKDIDKNTTSNASTATTEPSGETTDTEYVVKDKDSLWSIATQIAQAENLPTRQVMNAIQQQNPQAFIHGNPNLLRQGTVLVLPDQYQVITPKVKKESPTKASARTSSPAVKMQTKAPQQKPSPYTAKQQKSSVKSAKPPVATKVMPPAENVQNQAHMSVVGNTQKGNLQGGNKLSQAETKALQALISQIQSQRTLTLSLQNQVRQLDQVVRAKNQRIQVLNSRLAELQHQLQAKSTVAKPVNKSK